MADWNEPTTSTLYTAVLSELKDRDADNAVMFNGVTPSNIITNTIRWSSTNSRWEIWNGSSWIELDSEYAINVTSLGGIASSGFLQTNPGTDQTVTSGNLGLTKATPSLTLTSAANTELSNLYFSSPDGVEAFTRYNGTTATMSLCNNTANNTNIASCIDVREDGTVEILVGGVDLTDATNALSIAADKTLTLTGNLLISNNTPSITINDSNNGTGGSSYTPDLIFNAQDTEVGSITYNSGNMRISTEDFNSSQINMFIAGTERLSISSIGAEITGILAVSANSTFFDTITINNTTPRLNLIESSGSFGNGRFEVSSNDLYIAAPTSGSVRLSALNNADATAYQIRVGGAWVDILTEGGGYTITGDITFNDNAAINFGTGLDAELYHNGTSLLLDLNSDDDFIIRDGNNSNTERFNFDVSSGTLVVDELDVGRNSGGDSIIQFYDDNDNTQRDIRFDTSANRFSFDIGETVNAIPNTTQSTAELAGYVVSELTGTDAESYVQFSNGLVLITDTISITTDGTQAFTYPNGIVLTEAFYGSCDPIGEGAAFPIVVMNVTTTQITVNRDNSHSSPTAAAYFVIGRK